MKMIHITFSVIWMAAISYLFTHIHAWHQVKVKTEIGAQFFKLKNVSPTTFGLVHFLGEGCGCSKFIADYLIRRKPLPDVVESVWLIGEMLHLKEQLELAGFEVKELRFNDYKKSPAINIVPAYGVYDAQQTFHYLGAYTEGPVRPHSVFNDLSTIKELGHKRKVASLAVSGCVVSKEFQKLLDPFGLKYGVQDERKL